MASWGEEVNDDPPSNGGLRAESPSRAEISKSLRSQHRGAFFRASVANLDA